MSSAARAPALPTHTRAPARDSAIASAERPWLRTISFAALALYGIIRWGTLISPAPTGRLVGLLALALLLAGAGSRPALRRWPLGLAVAVLALLVMFALCGVPLAWIRHVRIELIGNGIGQGLASLPAVLLPYSGIDPWTDVVILLGAAILLLDGALSLAFAGSALTDLRRATAVLPLIALAVVPSTLLRPQYPYLQGLLLFGLIALFMWGERIQRTNVSAVIALCALAGAGAMVAAPGLDQHRPWVNYQALTAALAPTSVDTFNWAQTYGPINWPRKGRAVLDVAASRPDYWKAENLDVFDGRDWVAGSASSVSPTLDVDPSALARWTQTLTMTVRTMKISNILAAGAALRPADVPAPVFPGPSQGTWISSAELSPGDSYRVSVYSPHPSAHELARAGTGDMYLLAGYDTIELPSANGARPPVAVSFPPFHSALPALTGLFLSDTDGAAVMRRSPYAQAYALALRLAHRAATPYAFVRNVERYLADGFSYDESPPPSRYPLESFLFGSKLGYCQQFAGAMALLLRMGGVPARVSAGFTTGTYDTATRQWVVTDLDAHAWVEAWFPHYGWVRFDPTPPADPALSGRARITPSTALGGAAGLAKALASKRQSPTPSDSGPAARKAGGGSPLLVVGLALAALAALGLVLAAWRARAKRDIESLLAELERAMSRTGRPIPGGMTLAALERRVRGRPEAEQYIRALRVARFGSAGKPPTLRQRRALRAELRAGLGLGGALRALWALPPRWTPPRRASGTDQGA